VVDFDGFKKKMARNGSTFQEDIFLL